MCMFIKNRVELWAKWFSNNLGLPYAFLMAVVIVLTWDQNKHAGSLVHWENTALTWQRR